MADLIAQPRIIIAAGNKPKQIAEYVGRLNSGNSKHCANGESIGLERAGPNSRFR
jgi:hypothetical protein